MNPKHAKDEKIVEVTHIEVSQDAPDQDTKYHRLRDARETERYNDLMHQPVTLSTAQKLIGFMLAIVMAIVSVTGTYLVFKATTDYRLSEVEKRLDKNSIIIEHMGQFGFQGHEIRVSRLEIRVDTQQQVISDVKAKLDVCVEILTRLDKKMDTLDKGTK